MKRKSFGELMCDELQKLTVEVNRVKDKHLTLQFAKFIGSLKSYLAVSTQGLKDLREIVERIDAAETEAKGEKEDVQLPPIIPTT